MTIMQELKKYIYKEVVNHTVGIKLNALELLALYTMIDATDSSDAMGETKHKIEIVLKSYMTYILRDCEDISKKYDYISIFKNKSIEEANELLDIIVSDLNVKKK